MVSKQREMMMALLRYACLFLAAAASFGAAVAAQQFPGLGTPISEPFRAMFATCDRTDRFNGVQFPIRNKAGHVRFFGCHSDPSRFARFVEVPATGTARRAVIFESKLALDRDGSPVACGSAGGPTDQCGTSLMLDPTPTHPCVIGTRTSCVPVNADEIPYVVIPVAAPPGIDAREFRRRTGLDFGDYGVVIANGRTIPVIVADGGPAYKIGEGSTALLQALASDGRPHTITSGVTFVLFPGSRDPRPSLSPDTLARRVSDSGTALFAAFTAAHP
jgi:hypothetical protein